MNVIRLYWEEVFIGYFILKKISRINIVNALQKSKTQSNNLYENCPMLFIYNTPQKLDSKYKQKTNKFAV